MNYSEVIKEVSENLNISQDIVKKAYRAYWLFIKNEIQNLPLKESLTSEDFNKLKTSFNIPSLGKLFCDYERMVNVKKKFNIRNSLRHNVEDKEN